jgi:hypothetical protein
MPGNLTSIQNPHAAGVQVLRHPALQGRDKFTHTIFFTCGNPLFKNPPCNAAPPRDNIHVYTYPVGAAADFANILTRGAFDYTLTPL